jgi:hypothetical protein
MGFFSRDKGKSEPKFGGGWDKDKQKAKEKTDKAARDLERQRGTDGRGTGGKK